MAESIYVLHVDDNPDFADLAATFLEREADRITVQTATSASEGLDRLHDDVDCVVSDYDMSAGTGSSSSKPSGRSIPNSPLSCTPARGAKRSPATRFPPA